MPTNLSIPFIIAPPADLLTTHPDLKQLAADLSLKYVHPRIHQRVVTDDDLKTMGDALWRTLDQTLALEKAFATALQRAGQKVLPILIQTDQPALLALPWECLHHPEHGFLGRGKSFTLSRVGCGEPPGEPHHDELPKGPIRVLLFTSLPDDLDAEKERLDVEAEQANVLEALDTGIAEGWVDLTVPDDGRFDHFQSLLEKQEFHLVFLSGHGQFRQGNVRAGEPGAWFLFEGPDGRSHEIEADDIAKAFKGTAVRCVVLSACESGKESSEELNTGLAARLHGIGIPFVVGMRESVFDVAGTRFARAFCETLGRRERIDVAVQAARRAITQISPADEMMKREGNTTGSVDAAPELTYGQWCLPLLYSQRPEEPLIDWAFTPQPRDPSAQYRDNLAGIALPRQFIGRRRELRELMQAIASGSRQLLITGPGGQGKTALAGRLAQRLEEDGHPLIVWSARDGYRDSWERFLTRIQIQHLDDQHRERVQREWALCDTQEEIADLLLRALLAQTSGKLVLFLDNLETIQDPADGALKHAGLNAWLTACGKLGKEGPLVLLTSRIALGKSDVGCGKPLGEPHQLTSRIALKGDVGCGEPSGEPHQRTPDFIDAVRAKRSPASYPLPPPSYGDFLRYWQELAKESKTTQRHAQSAYKQRLYRALGGNFKGLELFTRRYGLDQEVAANGDKEGEAKREEQFLTHLESAKTELRAYMAVAQVVDWLEPEPTQLLTRLRVYGNPVIIDGVQAITLDLPGWKAALERLAMLSLVDVDLDLRLDLPRYRVTPLVADWLQETKGPLPVELRERAARYQQWAFENLGTTLGQGLITHAALQAAELTERAHVFALNEIVEWFDRAGMYRTLLADWLPAMRESGVPKIRAHAMNWSGKACDTLGDYRQALGYYTQSLEIYREIGDPQGEGATLNNIGEIHRNKGDYAQALVYYTRALAILRKIDDRKGEGTTLNNIAAIHQTKGDLDQALEYYIRSLEIRREVSDREGEAAILNNIATIHQTKDDLDKTLKYLTQSLAIWREIGNRKDEGITLNNISQIYGYRDDFDQALDYLTRSLAIRREIGDQAGEGTTLNNIATIYRARGELDQAMEYHTRSLTIQCEIGDRAGMCPTLFNMGRLHLDREEPQAALEYLVAAYRIAREIGEAEALNHLETLAHRFGVPEGEDGLAVWEKVANGEVTVGLRSSGE